MSDNLLIQIEERMKNFSKSQRLIGGFILSHYEKAAYMTAFKLGSAVEVSESTVVRFAIEMGFDGYPEMQKALQSLIKSRLTTLQRIDISNDRIGQSNILKATLVQDIERIRSTIESANEADFACAVERIYAAKNVYLLGAMSSNALARFFNYYLQLIFDNVHFVHEISTSGIYQQMFRINENDVFIPISFPRYSKNTINAATFAYKKGAFIVGITDSVASPLAKCSNILLIAKSDMASFADSLVAPLSLINALIVALSMKSGKDLDNIFKSLEEMWEENDVYDKDM